MIAFQLKGEIRVRQISSYTVAIILSLTAACKQAKPVTIDPIPSSVHSEIELAAPKSTTTTHRVAKGSSFYQSLRNEGLASSTILEIVNSAKPIFSLQGIGAGTPFEISWDGPEKNTPLKLTLRYAVDSSLVLERANPGLEWTASTLKHPITLIHQTFHGLVVSSLWESAEIAGMDSNLISSLAEVFAWQIDFNRQVKRGDRWRLTVEQKLVDNEVIGWGNILVAEYENNGQSFTGIRFPSEGSHASYYFPDGQSLKRMFTKSPIKFGQITSGFSHSRFHPILKENRPHNGVDYGAPLGTPVFAVGKGQIESISYNGSSGNMIKIRHNSTYATAYLHLSGFAAGLHRDSLVEQNEIIGYVGATGLATGPHLHFSFYENGVYVDPLGLRFPAADPIAKNQKPLFNKLVFSLMNTLPDWQLAQQDAH